MQPQELQTSWWMQYGAQPSDNPSELRDKRQKLLLLKEAITAYISKSSPHIDDAAGAADQQRLYPRHSPKDQHCSQQQQHVQSSAVVPASQPVSLQLECDVSAQPGLQLLQQPQAASAAQHVLQHQQLQAASAQPEQQQAATVQDLLQGRRPRQSDILSRLLGPAVPTAVAAIAGMAPRASGLGQDLEQQDGAQQLQQEQQWQRRRIQKSGVQQQRQQQSLQVQQQQRHHPQQVGGRRRLLPQPASKLAQPPQEHRQQQKQQIAQQQQASLQSHEQQRQQQKQQIAQQQHIGHQLVDAQSQAAGPGGNRPSAAATPAAASTWLPAAAAVQQLFSPRTAMHVPHVDMAAWLDSCIAEEQQKQQQLEEQQILRDAQQPADAAPAPQRSELHEAVHPGDAGLIRKLQQQHSQQHYNAATPPGSAFPQQQQPWQLQAGALAADACLTPTPCQMVPGTPCSEVAPAAGDAAAAGAGAGQGSDPCLVFGSFVAESPAVAASASAKQEPVTAAIAGAAAADVAQQLFVDDVPRPGRVEQQQQEAGYVTVATVQAAASPRDMHHDTPQQHVADIVKQQEQLEEPYVHQQVSLDVNQHAAVVAAPAQLDSSYDALGAGSSSTIALSPQHRTRSVDMGSPVVKILTYGQQCLVVMQQPSSSSDRFELLHLNVQQQHGVVTLSLGSLAVLSVPGVLAAAAASPAALLAGGVKLLPSCCMHKVGASNDTHRSKLAQQQQQAPAFLAVAASFKVSSIADVEQAAAADTEAAVVTPLGCNAQQPFKTPGSNSCSRKPSTGKKSLRSLSHSSGKQKSLLGRAPAAAAGCAQPGVIIYCMTPGAEAGPQQQQGGVVLLQRLHTAAAVTCLAVSDQGQMLAAAGSAGYACMWHLQPATDQQQQQQHQGAVSQPVDTGSMTVLPAAAYKGISFPDITDLCFVSQPSSSGEARKLLVGCCSQGSVAVWDVQRRQQVISVHTPDVNIHGLLPLHIPIRHSFSDITAAVVAPDVLCQQQQQQQRSDVVLLFALVATRGMTPPAAGRLSLHSRQQQQHFELRPVLLQQPATLVLGSSVLDHRSQQQHIPTGIQSAALNGTLAAAAVDGGEVVTVWDVGSGQTLMSVKQPPTLPAAQATAAATGILAFGAGQGQLCVGMVLGRQQQQLGPCRTCGGSGEPHVVVVGSSTGVAMFVLL